MDCGPLIGQVTFYHLPAPNCTKDVNRRRTYGHMVAFLWATSKMGCLLQVSLKTNPNKAFQKKKEKHGAFRASEESPALSKSELHERLALRKPLPERLALVPSHQGRSTLVSTRAAGGLGRKKLAPLRKTRNKPYQSASARGKTRGMFMPGFSEEPQFGGPMTQIAGLTSEGKKRDGYLPGM